MKGAAKSEEADTSSKNAGLNLSPAEIAG